MLSKICPAQRERLTAPSFDPRERPDKRRGVTTASSPTPWNARASGSITLSRTNGSRLESDRVARVSQTFEMISIETVTSSNR